MSKRQRECLQRSCNEKQNEKIKRKFVLMLKRATPVLFQPPFAKLLVCDILHPYWSQWEYFPEYRMSSNNYDILDGYRTRVALHETT